ncbi:S41 family peptidase [Deinococcus sp. KNUC1210]|uniref:S41 family peptidase n=1 Tax=Deinococcus sp. KNUC1210 TaxID=2917691 RepID=UPI001EEFDB62|nr:S41 family peptidase [Deinococcus sp. KNUC1210]ULH16828.1 S41 family peptidase [Deinococcus sp. KNUC1210]
MNRTVLVVGVLAATAAVGYAQMNTYSAAQVLPNSKSAQTFLQVFEGLNQLYLTKPDDDKLLRGAINGMIASLDDPFTYYEQPEDNAVDSQNLAGNFYGIGIQLTAANADGTGGKVDTVFKVGAAAQGGVQAGDVFLKIDGKDVTTAKLNDIVKLVRGEKGTKVTVQFGRGGANASAGTSASASSYTVTMERQPVTIVSVEQTMLPNNVGYIALNTFYNQQVNQQFQAAVADMKKKGVQKLILDLRDNGGGLLNSGIFVADQFLQSGPIVSVRDRSGKTDVIGSAKKEASDYTGKLVVLVNKNSASASEIVAGALQDTKRAQIIGEQSFGKGVGQQVVNTLDGGRVAIVNFTWITPNGHEIQKKGITPDVVVADNRRPTPLNFSGSGVPAGSKLTIQVAGKPVVVTADKDGKFTYTGDVARPVTSATQGEAIVDLKTDAELQKALDVLK